MAGLDTRGLASGFTQGFGLMNQYQQQQNQNERSDQQMGMRQERMDMQREQFDAQQEEVGRARDMEDLQFTLGKIGSGMDVSDDEMELLRKYPKFQAALDPDTDASIEQAQSVIDPESPVDGNDPESLAALNQMFGAEINKGDGGNKRVVGMVPGPDGESVMLELEMEGEDGKPYRAPMTKNRSNSEDDDLVMSVPVEKLVEQTQGMRMLRNTFRSPEAQASATKVLNLLRGESPEKWEQVKGPDGSILQRNTSTGEMKSVMGRSPTRSGSGYRSRPTATMKEAQWMVQQGIEPDIQSAFKSLNTSRGDDFQREKLQLRTINDDIKRFESRIESMRLAPGDPEYEQVMNRIDDLEAEREELSRRVFETPDSPARQAPSQESRSTEAPRESKAPDKAQPSADDLLQDILSDT